MLTTIPVQPKPTSFATPLAKPVNTAQPAQPTAAAQPAAPSPAPTAPTGLSQYGVSLTPTNPATDLRGQTIAVAPTANRQDLATNYLNTWNTATQPQFDADVRALNSQAAARGQIGSGQLRMQYGNLANARDVARNAQAQNFYTDALNNSINDAYNNVGIAQQQQGYQTGLQNQTYNQLLAALGLSDSLTNSAFGRAATTYSLGTAGNPSGAYQAAANTAGNSAANAGGSLMGLINGTVGNNSSNANTQSTLDTILGILRGGGSNTLPIGTPISDTGVFG